MNKQGLYDYMVKHTLKTDLEKHFSQNILDYAENMEENDQYLFLSMMLVGVPESIIRNVHF